MNVFLNISVENTYYYIINDERLLFSHNQLSYTLFILLKGILK